MAPNDTIFSPRPSRSSIVGIEAAGSGAYGIGYKGGDVIGNENILSIANSAIDLNARGGNAFGINSGEDLTIDDHTEEKIARSDNDKKGKKIDSELLSLKWL